MVMSESVTLPGTLLDFVDTAEWTFAKSMSEWPHEYIVRGRVNEALFVHLVRYIRANGLERLFYDRKFIYYEENGFLYWTMGAPLEETTIINRCKKENSYECRLRNGTLPE